MDLVIYGAQGIAFGAYKAINELCPARKVSCFLVTEMGNNASVLGGIPVRELSEFIVDKSQEQKDNIEVLICTPEDVMDAIERSLDEAGLYCHVRLDSIRWADMMQMAFVKNGECMPLGAYPVGYHKPVVHVYKAKCCKDKMLSEAYVDPDYMISIQVGTAQTKMRMAGILDNSADNISEKNGNYSELTGLYWIWKNQILTDPDFDKTYYGLAHYRRQLHLSEDDLLRMQDNDIDVVLPYPMPYEPNIQAHLQRYLADAEWRAVVQALEELQPEYAKAFKDIVKQGYLCNYNIIIAKGNVLADYCSWLFPILFRVEQINDPDRMKEPNRFIGYVGEALETLYFMYNKQNLRITHATCKFLV